MTQVDRLKARHWPSGTNGEKMSILIKTSLDPEQERAQRTTNRAQPTSQVARKPQFVTTGPCMAVLSQDRKLGHDLATGILEKRSSVRAH